jgi:hypothetical protein
MEIHNENLHTVFIMCELYEPVNSGEAGLHVSYKHMSHVIINTLKCHILYVCVELENITKATTMRDFGLPPGSR